MIQFSFSASNNEAEHEAVFAGLQLANEVRAPRIDVYSDSLLVVNKLFGEYQNKGENMVAYVSLSRGLLQDFKSYQLRQVPWDQNTHADTLAKLATDPEIEQ